MHIRGNDIKIVFVGSFLLLSILLYCHSPYSPHITHLPYHTIYIIIPPSHSSRAPLTACHRYVRLCSTNDRGHIPLCFDATLVVISDAMVIHSFSERRSHVKYVSILFPPPGSTTLNKEHQERRPHTEKTFPEQDVAL